MRRQPAQQLLFLMMCLLGCSKDTTVPGFAGTIVTHVDSYGSGTGTSSQLSPTGQVQTGFDYSDDSKTDWKADIKWSFQRRDGDEDVYRIEWLFPDGDESSDTVSAELAFDGKSTAMLPVSNQLIISIEPARPAGEGKSNR